MTTFKQFLEQTWNGGYMNIFNSDPSMTRGSRHRANIIRDIGNRKHLNTVPEYKKPDMDIIGRVEKIKNKFSHYEPINDLQLKQICKKYNIYKVTKDVPKKLGNTGIAIVWDDNLKSFAIKK
jgi:hypothetical protein